MKNSQIFSIRKNKTVFWIGLTGLTILSAILSIWMGSVRLSVDFYCSADRSVHKNPESLRIHACRSGSCGCRSSYSDGVK